MIPDLLCGFDAPVSPKNPESRQRRRISEALRRPGDGMPMGMAGGAVCSFYTGLLVRRAIRGTVIVIVVTIVPRPAARRRDARHGRETCTRPRIASPSAIGRIARIDPANKNSLKLASDPDARRGCRADWSLAGHVAGAPAYAVRRTPTPQVTRRIAVVPPARQRPTPDARTLDAGLDRSPTPLPSPRQPASDRHRTRERSMGLDRSHCSARYVSRRATRVRSRVHRLASRRRAAGRGTGFYNRFA